MNIFAAEAAQSTCADGLPGCAAHLDGVTHLSVERTIVATAAAERHEIYVGRELAPGQPPAVRLQGAADAPMAPEQALQLGLALVAEAFAAQVWAVTR